MACRLSMKPGKRNGPVVTGPFAHFVLALGVSPQPTVLRAYVSSLRASAAALMQSLYSWCCVLRIVLMAAFDGFGFWSRKALRALLLFCLISLQTWPGAPSWPSSWVACAMPTGTVIATAAVIAASFVGVLKTSFPSLVLLRLPVVVGTLKPRAGCGVVELAHRAQPNGLPCARTRVERPEAGSSEQVGGYERA